MKKNDIYDVIIEEVIFPNKGMAIIEGQKVYVKDTLKGQKARIRITKKKKNKVEGSLIEVLEKAPMEQDARCEHFENCGGCVYQHLPYSEQIKMKATQVKNLLDEAGIKEYEFLGIELSPSEWAYRNKMEFSFGDVEKDGELALGMRKKGSMYEVVTASGCQIIDKDFRDVLVTTLEFFKERGISFYHKKLHTGVLRHLVVRKAFKTGEILINLVTSSQQQLDLGELIEQLRRNEYVGEFKGFLHTINDGLADIVKSDETRILYGQDYFTEKILGLTFKISAFSFFQTNSLGAEKLYSIVRDFAGETNDKTIFDLYCGTGTIAQIMAPVAKKVIGVEIVEEAVEAAKENAMLNSLDNCEFIAGDVLTKVDELKETPDLIILDPPRDGIHPKAIDKIINFGAAEMIYVSCKPTSLARDLKLFVEKGYRVDKVKCMDMFPHTPHVETVVRLYKER